MNITIHYRALSIAFIALITISVMLATYIIAATPSRVASRLGMRGLKRQRALKESPLWEQVEPLVRWLGVRISGTIDDATRRKLDASLSAAGDFWGITADEYIALSILSGLGGFVVGSVFGIWLNMGMIVILFATLTGLMLPYISVTDAHKLRLKQVNRGLPYAADLLALAMSAGQDFPGAIRQVVEKSSDPNDALVEEFSRLLHELQVGMSRKQALTAMAERVPTDSMIEFVGSIVQAEERGNPVADVLQVQATVSRNRRSVRAEEAAAKASVQLVAPLFLLFFCTMILVMGPMVIQMASTFD